MAERKSEMSAEWIRTLVGAEMVGLTSAYFVEQAKSRGIPYVRKETYWWDRKAVESWAELRKFRRDWYRKHARSHLYPRHSEKLDLAHSRALFITVEEAAKILEIAKPTVHGLVKRGRLPCYQSMPGHRGSQLWFSKRAVERFKEDEMRLKRRAGYENGVRFGAKVKPPVTSVEGMRFKGAHKLSKLRIPSGLLSTAQAARRLGVTPGRVRELRVAGRIRGERLWRRSRELKYWYFRESDIEQLLESPEYLSFRNRWRERTPLGPPARGGMKETGNECYLRGESICSLLGIVDEFNNAPGSFRGF